MAYVTDRKRAAGLGAAKTGTLHHWRMMVSSVALIVLIPLFVFTFGTAVGCPMTRCWPTMRSRFRRLSRR